MSSLFSAICPHGLHFDSELNDLAQWAISEIATVYSEHGSRFEGFPRRLTFDGPYRHSIEFFKDPDTVCIRIDTPHAFSVQLYPYGAVFTSLHKTFMVSEDNMDFLVGFREELLLLMRIFGCTEAIYLRQDAPAHDMAESGISYESTRQWLIAEHGPTVSDLSSASLQRLWNMGQPWYLDEFADHRQCFGTCMVSPHHQAWYEG